MNDRLTHVLLMALLVGQLILLMTHPRTRGSLFEQLILTFMAPISHSASGASESFRGLIEGLRSNRELRGENGVLRAEIAGLRRQLVRFHGVEEELERLSRLSNYRRPQTGEAAVGDIVYVDDRSWLRTMVLYAGTTEPKRNQPVVTQQGLVGRVLTASGHYAKVQLITDRSSSVSAMIERTRRKGIVQGSGHGLLELEYIPLQADVAVGDRIVTAGIDGVFPRGLPIGEVIGVDPGRDLFHRIEISPAIDLRLLDQVYLLTQEVLPNEIREQFADEIP